MFDALKELLKDEIAAERAKAANEAETAVSLEAIKNIMSEFKYTEEQAMDLLKIDPSKRSLYAAMLQDKKQ